MTAPSQAARSALGDCRSTSWRWSWRSCWSLWRRGSIDRNHTYFTNFEASFVIILRNTVLLGIIALGAAVVIIAGGIDLSAGSMIAFSATTCASIMVLFAEPDDKRLVTVRTLGVLLAIGGGILSGFLVGTLHTWLITSIRLPPFVATLATLVGLRSFARAMCEFITTQRWGSQYQQVNVNYAVFHLHQGAPVGRDERLRRPGRRHLADPQPHGARAGTSMPWAATSRRPGFAAFAPTTSSGSPIASAR